MFLNFFEPSAPLVSYKRVSYKKIRVSYVFLNLRTKGTKFGTFLIFMRD